MTRWPHLAEDFDPVAGVVGLLLFVVFAAVFLTASLGDPTPFADGSITAGLGYSLFNFASFTNIAVEGFLGAFELVDLVLVAALVAAVMLGRRESDTTAPLEEEER